LNTGSDSYVTSVSDTSEFNVFQQLKIYDNYWETLFARHIVNAANAGSVGGLKQANIQGNTEGWCRADHMCLLVPITYTYTSDYVFSADTEFSLAMNAPPGNENAFDTATNPAGAAIEAFFALANQRFVNNPYVVFSEDTLGEHFNHAWMGGLDVFNRLRLLIGNNGQPIQKQIETEPIGLKYHASTQRCGQILQQTMAQWGLPNVSGFHQHVYAQNDAIFNLNNLSALTDVNPVTNGPYPMVGGAVTKAEAIVIMNSFLSRNGRTKENQASIINAIEKRFDYKDESSKFYFQMLSEIDYLSNFDTRTLERGVAPAQDRFVITTKKRYLTLPLQSVIPLFRGSKFLPPDFRFKFEFEVNDGRVIAKRMSEFVQQSHPVARADVMDTGRHPWRCKASIKAAADAGGIELQYPYHILRQPVQAAISSMWLQKPFLYYFDIWERRLVFHTSS
jgi:hypothetical protein